LIATFNDGSYVELNLNIEPELDDYPFETERIYFSKPQVDELRNITLSYKSFKIIGNQNKKIMYYMFIGSNGSIYITHSYQNNKKFINEIPGNFDNGLFINWHNADLQRSYPNSIVIAGFDKGMISYYLVQIDLSSRQFRYIKVTEDLVHYEKITFIFLKDHMIMTARLDCSLKIFLIYLNPFLTEIKFDRSESDIEKMSISSENEVISHSERNFILWNLSTCKITGIFCNYFFIFYVANKFNNLNYFLNFFISSNKD